MPRNRSTCDWADVLLAGVMLAGTAFYVALLPRNLGAADESVYLYEAKRILNGQVIYRDIFEIITPGWMYLMAGLFWLFGTDLATARIATAVLHGVAAALVYLSCRRMGVRRGLSWPAALGYLVACQSAWPIASQHWLSTLLCIAVLWLCLGRRRERASWPLLPGFVIGLLIAVQQQRGLVIAFGIAAWLLADSALQRRYELGPADAPLAPQLAWLAAGTLLVVAPLCVTMIAGAGFERVWRALVIHPIVNYRGTTHCEWGHINAMTAWNGSFTFPRVLKYLPLILVLSGLRLLSLWVARRGREEAATLLLLIVFCGASMLSIAYFPDFIHIAFIAPAFLVTISESLEWAVRRTPVRPGLVQISGWVAGAVLLAACGWRLQHNLERLREAYSITRRTAFGRVDFANPKEVLLYDKLSELMEKAPSRDLFCYPVIAHYYLMVDGENPTPYGFFLPGYNSPDQVQELLDHLEAKRPAYVVAFAVFVPPNDPVIAYIERHYEPIPDAGPAAKAIFRRRAAG